MKRSTFTLFAIVLLCLTAAAQGNESSSDVVTPVQWKTLTGSNFSIQYPENYDLDSSGNFGTTFSLFSRQSSPEDKFRENINLISQEMEESDISLEGFAEMAFNEIKNIITNASIVENKLVSNGQDQYQQLIFDGVQGIFSIRFEQHYRIINNTVFVLTFTAERNQYDQFRDTAAKIMGSFKAQPAGQQ